jgi:putative MATE family efflux protein
MQVRAQRDITQGSLSGSIWHLSWPITISMALFSLPSIYDAFWLGRLGPGAQAASGLTMSVRITMISVVMALSLGSGAVVSRYVGAKDQDNANLSALQAVVLMAAASGILGIIGLIFVRPLMSLAGADADTLPLAVRYARIIFIGLIAMEMVPSMGFMLNAAGAPQVLLGMTVVSTGAQLITEPLLVRWFDLEGAALALVLANTAGMAWGFFVMLTGRAPVRLDLRNLRLDFPMMERILRVAIPGVVLRGAPNLAMTLLTRLIAWYGAPVLAAWVIVQRVYNAALIPSFGVARTAPAMVGQNLGAAQPERASRSVYLIAGAATLIGAVIVALVGFLAPQILAIFTDDSETTAIGIGVLQTLTVGFLAFTVTTVFDAAQAGAGDTVSPMVINLISLWLVQVPLAYVLSRLTGLDADGIWLALNLGWIVQAALMGLRFRQGRWKVIRVF